MKKDCYILLITLFIMCYDALAQQPMLVDKWRLYLQEMIDESEDEEAIESLVAELTDLSEHPFDLNRVSAESLHRLPFLSDEQIDQLLAFRQRTGRFETLYELKNIPSMDRHTIELLLPFITIGPERYSDLPGSLRGLLKAGKHELMMHYDRCLQQKQGYLPQSDTLWEQHPNRRYQGEPFHLALRYGYRVSQRVEAGVVVEKDRGEPLFNRFHKGFDYYSAHLLLHDVWKFKTLALGDYRATFGQGLVLCHDLMTGKRFVIMQGERRNNGFRRHYSTNESDFFRGAATTFQWRNFQANLFYSYRLVDATVQDQKIRAFKIDGLHRLVSERARKGAAPVQHVGANIRYAAPSFVIGVTALRTDYRTLTVDPPSSPTNLFAFRGRSNLNLSVDYLLKKQRVKLFGESALSKNGGWATLNALQWVPTSYIQALLLYRYYARDYHAYYGRGFSQSLRGQNEEGLFLSMLLKPLNHLKVTTYADFFRHPWMKKGIDAPSSGLECLAQLDYEGWKNHTIYLRYRYKQREANRLEERAAEAMILPSAQHRVRLQLTHASPSTLLLISSLDASFYEERAGRFSRGWMVAQRVDWRPPRGSLELNLYAAAFFTDNYFSRIYSYEKQLLYQFNRPSLYGKGIRVSSVIRFPLSRKMVLFSKCGWTHSFDASTLGSGLETIEGRNRVDCYLLMRWNF